ncbi:MAG TPA: NAD(P)H-binding protein [Candidatus Limnocylindrales bacterium]
MWRSGAGVGAGTGAGVGTGAGAGGGAGGDKARGTRVLVTGATGTLGRQVVAALDGRPGVVARILSRRAPVPEAPGDREWVVADLATDPLDAALAGVDAVIHLASAKGTGDADVGVAGRLLAASASVGVRHLVVISIIGCDRIPLPFYASKVQIEELTRTSGVPWSIVRVAQFHSFVEHLVATLATLPIPTPIVADLRFQPVDEREVAERLVEMALGEPLGDAPEIAGPEVLTLGEIAATWLRESRRPASLVPVPLDAILLGAGPSGAVPSDAVPSDAVPSDASDELQSARWVSGVLEGYRAAANTPRGDRILGQVRFVDWLRRRAGSESR